MAEYSRSARGTFTSTGAAQAVYLPFQPQVVSFKNYTAAKTPANHGIPSAYWDVDMGQGFAVCDLFNATPVLTTGAVETNGISTFSAGLLFQYGSQIAISGITKASPAVVTTGSAHGYSTGDVVIFEGLYQSSTTGMPQLCGIPFVITVTGSTTFSIAYNTNQSSYTALSASPSGAYVKKVLYPFLYAPGASVITAIGTGTTTTVTTSCPHNFVLGQQVCVHVPTAWGTTQLNSLPNNTIPGQPTYYYVTTVNSSTQVTISANSTGYTAFATNQTVAQVNAGLTFAQICAVGDVNTGGVQISAGSVLYPPP
ncbi:MAG: hypothetical protein KGN01_05295, partial [Patescibacteria group bacterium]|nr:hypothetical protein [Patescibacteria group bacterium]